MQSRRFIKIVLFIVFISFTSCSLMNKKEPGSGAIRIDDIRGGSVTGEVVVKSTIDRVKYRQSLINTEINSVRVIEIFQRRAKLEARNYPMYRIFDIQKGVAYDMLGLKNNDVIVSAGGYVIQDGMQFKEYVNVLEKVYDNRKNEKELPCIEIIRDGIPYKFIYYFIDAKDF